MLPVFCVGHGMACLAATHCLLMAVLQKTMQTQRTLSIPLVDSRGHGGMASMDPAGSAVLLTDMYTADPAHLLGANDTS